MSAPILSNYEEASHKLFKKHLYILFGYFLLIVNLAVTYSVYNQGDIFQKILFFSIFIFILIILTLIISLTLKNNNQQLLGYTLLLYSFYLYFSILFYDRGTIITWPLLMLLLILFQTIKYLRYTLLLLVLHVAIFTYLLTQTGPTSIAISYGYYIYVISASLLMVFFLYEQHKFILQYFKQYEAQIMTLKERNDELRNYNQQISESEATSINRFKEINQLLNKYEALTVKYQSLIMSTNHGLIDYDITTRVLTFSDKACQLLSIQNHQVMDWSKIADRMPHNDRIQFSQMWSNLLDNLSTFEQIHVQYKHDDSHKSHLSFQFNHYTNNNLEENHIVGLIKDVTVEMEQANRITYLAFYDYLTDLPNRTKFLELFGSDLLAKKENHCIICINIDNFKTFNRTNGFDNGNRMLRHIGDALKNTYESATVSRIYSNTFAISMHFRDPIEDELLYIQSILDHLAILHFNTYNFTCSIGAIIIKSLQLKPEAYLNLAEEIMYQAKLASKGSYLVITKEN